MAGRRLRTAPGSSRCRSVADSRCAQLTVRPADSLPVLRAIRCDADMPPPTVPAAPLRACPRAARAPPPALRPHRPARRRVRNAASPHPPATSRHLFAVDLARVLTVALVIAVHLVSGAAATSVAEGALVTVFHVSREGLLLITAFVLVYSFERKPLPWHRFWVRRYPFVVLPYLAWSVIYFLADGHLDPTTATLRSAVTCSPAPPVTTSTSCS